MRFAGEFERTLDAKNRIVMPPKLKNCLEDGKFVLCCMPSENFIRVYKVDDWDELTDKHLFIDDGVDRTALQRYVFHNSENCELDAQNRFALLPKFIERAGIQRDIVLIGVGKRAEIWAKEKYEQDVVSYEAQPIVIPF